MRYLFLTTFLISTSVWAAPQACYELFSKSNLISQISIEKRINDLADFYFGIELSNRDHSSQQVKHLNTELEKLILLDPQTKEKFKALVQKKSLDQKNASTKKKEILDATEKQRKSIVKKSQLKATEHHSLDHLVTEGARNILSIPNSSKIVVLDNNSIQILDMVTGAILFRHDEPKANWPSRNPVIKDDKIFFLQQMQLRSFDLNTGAEQPMVKLDNQNVYSKLSDRVSFSANGTYIQVLGDSKRHHQIFETKTGKFVKQFKVNFSDEVEISADEKFIFYSPPVLGTSHRKLQIIDIATGSIGTDISEITRFSTLKNGELLIIHGRNGKDATEVFDRKTFSVLQEWEKFNFSDNTTLPDQKFIIANPVRLRHQPGGSLVKNIETGETVYEDTNGFSEIRVSPAGHFVLGYQGDQSKELKIVHIKTKSLYGTTGTAIISSERYLSRDDSFLITGNKEIFSIVEFSSGYALAETQNIKNNGYRSFVVTADEKYVIFYKHDDDEKPKVFKIDNGMDEG